MNAIVLECLLHPQKLSAARSSSNVFRFSSGERYTVLLLWRPTYKWSSQKVTCAWCRLAINLVTSKTKHIEIRHHFLRDHVVKEDIDIIHVNTEEQLADIFTKPLDEKRFCKLRCELNILESSNVLWSGWPEVSGCIPQFYIRQGKATRWIWPCRLLSCMARIGRWYKILRHIYNAPHDRHLPVVILLI